jgi:DNA (cytosine-5)-methyltransferase 1
MRTLHLFAGAGGGLLADLILGHDPVGYVEIDDYCQKVIAARIKDGILPEAPIFGDIRAFNREGFAGSYTGLVGIVAGGFPCQDISVAGKGKGIGGERSGLWGEMAETIRVIKPRFVFVENSPALTFRGAGRVFGDLARMGFDAKWGVLSAHETGSPHLRKRMWICAYSDGERWPMRGEGYIKSEQKNGLEPSGLVVSSKAWETSAEKKSIILGMVDGVANGMDRIKAVGNGQCPQQAALAWSILSQ